MSLALLDFENLEWGGRGFGYALENAHLPGLVVSLILLILSVLSWTIMFTKFSMVKRAARQNYRFFKGYRNSKTILEGYEANVTVPGSTLFAVYRSGCRELAFHLLGTLESGDKLKARMESAQSISPAQMDSVRASMDRTVGESVLHLENRMNMLATAVSGAPFLGLLGTVWGVMETFSAVASSSSAASIQTMAPGVAAALVTTVVALLVAIPAMFGYNWLISRIRTLIQEMNTFASELSTAMERQYVDFSPAIVTVPSYSNGHGAPHSGNGAEGPPQPSQLPYTSPDLGPSFSPGQGKGQVARPAREGPPINPIARQVGRPKRPPRP